MNPFHDDAMVHGISKIKNQKSKLWSRRVGATISISLPAVISALVWMCMIVGSEHAYASVGMAPNATPSGATAAPAPVAAGDIAEKMRDSIVYLEIATYAYDQSQPWKHESLAEGWACGCAVDKYTVLTTARNVANLSFVKALRYGQNDFIPAKLRLVDYESDLCLIELDPNRVTRPLVPLAFGDVYEKGAEVTAYWLNADKDILKGRGYLDRARVDKTSMSFGSRLRFLVADTSRRTGRGEVYCIGSTAIGIAGSSSSEKETGLIPAEMINRFVKAATAPKYQGFGEVGFVTSSMPDPAMRALLRMPETLQNGVYVADVYTLGTGHESLKSGDVILSIDGHGLDPYGRYAHPKYEQVDFDHLITSETAGHKLQFELWRQGQKTQIEVAVEDFSAADMLVPYYELDQQPQYVVTAGFVLQRLTREYMAQVGEDWEGRISPHLYHYYRDMAFKPTPERRDIVILSYVLPAPVNLGYSKLGQMVVKSFNGMTIRSMKDLLAAQKLNPDSKYDVIEFELDNPTVVIPRQQLAAVDPLIARNYGISRPVNINP